MNSKEYTDYIVEQLTELRDLIIVIERGGKEAPDVLYKVAIEKSRHITSYMQQWREEAAPDKVQVPAEYAEWIMGKTTEETAVEEKMEQAVSDDEAMEKSAIDIPMSMDVALPDTPTDAPVEDDLSQPADTDNVPVVEMPFPLVAETDTDDIIVGEYPDDAPLGEVSVVSEEDEQQGEVAQPDKEIESNDVACPDDDTMKFETPAVAVEDSEVSVDVDDEDDEQQVYNMGEPFDTDMSTDANMTVGEMMSVRRAKELRRAISLNDRFRFRRELFGNSDVRMTETLALIDAMTDCGEAREYLLNDLGWDVDEPVVKEFLALVENHFKQ